MNDTDRPDTMDTFREIGCGVSCPLLRARYRGTVLRGRNVAAYGNQAKHGSFYTSQSRLQHSRLESRTLAISESPNSMLQVDAGRRPLVLLSTPHRESQSMHGAMQPETPNLEPTWHVLIVHAVDQQLKSKGQEPRCMVGKLNSSRVH